MNDAREDGGQENRDRYLFPDRAAAGAQFVSETGNCPYFPESCDLCQRPGVFYAHAGRYRVLRCRRCGLLWTDPLAYQDTPRDTSDRVAQIYLAHAEAQAKRFRHQLDLTISKAGWSDTDRLRVLEVGTGLGFFLDVCEERGIAAEGCDIDARRVEYANRRRQRVRLGTLDASYDAAAFDAVFAFNLIEHLAHPRDFLSQARRVLKPGGVLALETPIQESLFHALARVAYLASGGRVFLLAVNPGGHNHKFSRRTFKTICDDMGFAIAYQRNVASPWGEIWGKSFMMPRGRRLIYRLALPIAWVVARLAGGGNRLFILLRKR